jgi:hypothetical protein
MQWVQRIEAIALNDHVSRLETLHRTAIGVKFNKKIVISSELVHRNQILISFGETRTLLRNKLDGSCAKQCLKEKDIAG